MESEISATDLAKRLSDVLNRVHYRGESFVVRRGRDVVCSIGPAGPHRLTLGELYTLLASMAPLDADYAADVSEARGQLEAVPGDTWDT